MQQQEKVIQKKINYGTEVLMNARSTDREEKNKTNYIKKNLSDLRVNIKEDITKRLRIAKSRVNRLYESYNNRQDLDSNYNQSDKQTIDLLKKLLKKLSAVSSSTEAKKEEIDKNLENLTNFFNALGMPNASNCLYEYERVIITNNSLSKNIEFLLREIYDIQQTIKALVPRQKSPAPPRLSSPVQSRSERLYMEYNDTSIIGAFQLFSDLNLRLNQYKELNNQTQNFSEGFTVRNLIQSLSSFHEKIIKVERLILENIPTKNNEYFEVNIVNNHPYIKEKLYRLDKKILGLGINTDNKKKTKISDLKLDKELLGYQEFNKTYKKKNLENPERNLTPLDTIDIVSSDNEISNLSKPRDTQNNPQSSLLFDKEFDKTMKKVVAQTLATKKLKGPTYKAYNNQLMTIPM